MQRPRKGARHWAEHCQARDKACRLVEGGEPAVEEAARGGVGDQAHLIAEAGQANEDGRVNGADVVSRAGGHRSVGWITKDDGVDLGCRSSFSSCQPMKRLRMWRWRNG